MYDRKDKYYQKAKKEGYPSRSAYKLIEMDRRFGILKKGARIVDLGCAPGGWMKVAEKHNSTQPVIPATRIKWERESRVGFPPKSCTRGGDDNKQRQDFSIVGIDLLPLQYQPGPSVAYIQGDFLEEENQKKIVEALNGKADWVLSDLSPNISGIKFRDADSSTELCFAALEFTKKILKNGGGLVVKIFPGAELEGFKKEVKKNFQKMTTFIPEATRQTSREIYLVAQNFNVG